MMSDEPKILNLMDALKQSIAAHEAKQAPAASEAEIRQWREAIAAAIGNLAICYEKRARNDSPAAKELVDDAWRHVHKQFDAGSEIMRRTAAPPAAVRDPSPVLYHLDEGKVARAVLIGHERLIVDLTSGDGPSVVGKPDWFDAGYVAAYGGLVPESASEGTEPGQWSYGVFTRAVE